VTLRAPYPGGEDRISVQYAVKAIVEQVGLSYSFSESYENTKPTCRAWVRPDIRNMPCHMALRSILEPTDLTYELRGKTVVLVRQR